MNSFYEREELESMGFAALGDNVLISRKSSIYGACGISIGSNVRIDDFTILSGKITIGNYIHISAYTSLFAGSAGIVMDDFSGISSRCAVYAQSDDYKGNALTNPMVPEEFRGVYGATVYIGRHVLIGTGSTVLPGVTLGEGSSFGAMTLINKNAEPFTIYTGVPMRKHGERSRKILDLEAELMKQRG